MGAIASEISEDTHATLKNSSSLSTFFFSHLAYEVFLKSFIQ